LFRPAAPCDKLISMDRRTLNIALTSYRGNMFCGGQGVYLVNLARALVKRGHRVTVFSGPPWPDKVEGTELVMLPDENYINKPASHLGPKGVLSVLQPLNMFEYISSRVGSNPEMTAFSLRSFSEIKRRHKLSPFDIVHDNQGLGYGLLLTKTLGVPVAATIHHPLQVDRKEDIKQTEGAIKKAKRAVYYPLFMQSLVANRLDRLIAVSAFSRDLVRDTFGLNGTRGFAVVPNGVDTSVYRPLPEMEREPGRLLFVGSTEDRKKGVRYLLSALARLPERFRLIIVDGRRYPGRVYAADMVRSLGLSDRVAWKDGIDNEELVKEYNRAFAMVVPSLFEGFGLPALEAMACGTPLLSTGAGGLSEVTGDECAIKIEPEDGDSIMEAVLRLEADPELGERLSRTGAERARTLFTWERAAELTEAEYLGAIEDRTRRA